MFAASKRFVQRSLGEPVAFLVILLSTWSVPSVAQNVSQLSAQSSGSTPVVISLDEAIRRAEQNEPIFAAAMAEQRAVGLDRSIAGAALLPSVIYHNQALYTQPNGLKNQAGQTGNQSAPIFIANNAVHEYASQASINETLGLKQVADFKAGVGQCSPGGRRT